jgi:hypothetical protein
MAGHTDPSMTMLYTFVAPERQNQLTQAIQERLQQTAQEIQRKQQEGLEATAVAAD